MTRALNRGANLILLFLGIYPQIYMIADALQCHVDLAMPVWIAALCVCVWFAACFPHGLFVGMPMSAAALFLAYWSYGTNPTAQLVDLFDRITGVYYETIYSPGSVYSYSDAVISHSLLLVFLAFLLAAYLAAALSSRGSRISLSLLGTAPFFLLCLSVDGTPPVAAVVCMLLFWILLLVSGNSYREDRELWRQVLAVLLPASIMLTAILLVFNPNRYEYTAHDVELSQRFDRLSDLLNRWAGHKTEQLDSALSEVFYTAPQATESATEPPVPQTAWGDLTSDMHLDRKYDLSAAENIILHARCGESGIFYLRALSFGDYSGTGWLKTEDSVGVNSLSLAAQAVSFARQSGPQELEIRSELLLENLCLPYFTVSEGVWESYVPSFAQTEYNVSYYSAPDSFSEITLPAEYLEDEQNYRDFAHDFYTRLPDTTRSAVLTLCEQAGISASTENVIQRVAEFVRSSGEYDITVQPYPSDDYAIYFLTVAHRGYCVHFATAAAVIYRSMGIPARVTQGFLLRSEAGRDTDIAGTDAHAWVEVYQDGLGWLPVEVTGQSGPVPESSAPADQVPVPSESPAPVALDTSEQTSTDDSAPASHSSPNSLPVGVLAENAAEQSHSPAANKLHKLIPFLLVLLVLFALPFLWYRLARRIVKRRLNQDDKGKAVIAMYHYAKYAEGMGGKMPDEIRVCAERACFSQHPVSEEEAKLCHSRLSEMLADLYPRLKIYNKLRLKIGKGLR